VLVTERNLCVLPLPSFACDKRASLLNYVHQGAQLFTTVISEFL
jgi:hypothetical protein